jgi:uncharacterized protein
MIARIAREALLRTASSYPVTIITGPRQSGKTSLVRTSFPDKLYISLDSPVSLEAAQNDPIKFISHFPDGAIVDEAHRCPEICSYIIDSFRTDSRTGLFFLVSPIQFGALLENKVAAEGSGGMRLLPLSFLELAGTKDISNINELFFKGFYPPVCERQLNTEMWYAEYIMNYIERDLRHILNVRSLKAFRQFIRLCAQHSGYILNLSALASGCGITHNTAKAWIAALEASHIIFLLEPHPQTFGRRTFKLPKLYFYDVGLAASLLGMKESGQIEGHAAWPMLFETFVISELVKTRFNAGAKSNLFYWCDSSGNEISVVAERGDALIPIKIVSGQPVSEKHASFLIKWRRLNRQTTLPACLIYNGHEQVRLNNITAYPWHEIGEFGPLFTGAAKAYLRK